MKAKSMKDIVQPNGYTPQKKISEKTLYLLIIVGVMIASLALFFLIRNTGNKRAQQPGDTEKAPVPVAQVTTGQIALTIDVSDATQSVGYQLAAGDVVQVFVLREGVVSAPEELQFVEVLGITAYEQTGENGALARRYYITLSLTQEQARMLLALETSGNPFYTALAANSDDPERANMLRQQAQILDDKFSQEAEEAARKAEEEARIAEEEAARKAEEEAARKAEEEAAAKAAAAAASESGKDKNQKPEG